jgi:hypothetical protein
MMGCDEVGLEVGQCELGDGISVSVIAGFGENNNDENEHVLGHGNNL